MNCNTYLFGKCLERKTAWTEKEIERIFERARGKRGAMREVPSEYLLDTLSKAGDLFADKKGRWYKQAFAEISGQISFSKPVIEQTLNILPALLKKDELKKRMALELFLPEALDNAVERKDYGGFVRAVPKGVVLHVGAGNVFLGIIDSLILGILTKNVNILKTSSSGSTFPVMFARALAECDRKGILSGSMSVLTWPGGETALEKAAACGSDAVFVWGGSEAVEAYRNLAPEGVEVTGFGPKVSLSVITAESLKTESLSSLAEKTALDASLWDQSACSSPHAVYFIIPETNTSKLSSNFNISSPLRKVSTQPPVELRETLCKSEGGWKPGEGDKVLQAFTDKLAEAFSAVQKTIPQGKLSDDEKVEITKARELAKVDSAVGEAYCRSSFPETHWTVIAEKDPAFKISPLNRVLYVKRARSLEELKKILLPFSGYIQSVAVSGSAEDRKNAAASFSPVGLARVTEPGKMLETVTGSPHDGIFPMGRLVDWIGVEGKPLVIEKLAKLVEFAKSRSPFYKKHFSNLAASLHPHLTSGHPRSYRGSPLTPLEVESTPSSRERDKTGEGNSNKISSLEDFQRLPLLAKEDILSHTPPRSLDFFTSPLKAGIYFASGGSTGSPKYIFFDAKEYDGVCKCLGRAMEAGGLTEKDIAANLFVAGNLWSSFISVEKALSHTGALSVPLGSALEMETILKFLDEFKVTALIGLPSFLLKVAEAIKASKGKYRLPVRRIFFGGEYVTPGMAAFFRKVFPGVLIRSAAYATVDAGVIAFQCEKAPAGVHHLFEEEVFIEVIDTATLKPVKAGETGELVVTPLKKRHMPLIRYRLGDLARLIPGKCSCGRPEPLFEILGRCDDRIHIGGAHIFLNDIQTAIGEVKPLSFNFQIRISTEGHREVLTIRVETRSGVSPSGYGKIAEDLMKAIRKNCDDLVYVIDRNWIFPPRIEVLPPEGIARVARTGKIPRVIDLRIKNNSHRKGPERRKVCQK